MVVSQGRSPRSLSVRAPLSGDDTSKLWRREMKHCEGEEMALYSGKRSVHQDRANFCGCSCDLLLPKIVEGKRGNGQRGNGPKSSEKFSEIFNFQRLQRFLY